MLNLNDAQPIAILPSTETVAAVAGPDQSLSPRVKVWLVDDNDELRTLVAELLGLQGGIECARHFSSPDALLSALASKPGPDVILLDVQMGDRNGLDAVRPIKSLTRTTRVLMFTTCFNQDWRERALSDGASDYLLKSEPLERLAERIRRSELDPIPRDCSRRRSNKLVELAGSKHAANLRANRSPHLFGRTLERLRSLWN